MEVHHIELPEAKGLHLAGNAERDAGPAGVKALLCNVLHIMQLPRGTGVNVASAMPADGAVTATSWGLRPTCYTRTS